MDDLQRSHECRNQRGHGTSIRCRLGWWGGLILVGTLLGGLAASTGTATAGTPLPEADTTQPASVFDAEAGRLMRRYVSPEQYRGNQQNWAAAQDSSGLLYVSNSNGVLVYDGHDWRTLSTANNTGSVSLTSDEKGRIFVGASNDFGVLRTDSLGHQRYVSLATGLPEQHGTFDDIRNTEAADKGIYFQSDQHLFRWTPATDSLKMFSIAGTEFQHADAVRGTLYVNVTGKGLMTPRGRSLQLVPGGEQLADRSVRFLLPYEDGEVLVGTFRGLLRWDGSSFDPISTNADDLLREAWLYDGRRLRDGTIAIATIDRGLLLLSPDGRVRRHLGARGDPVTGLYEDREGGLWALLDGGMIRYEVGSAFTEYDRTTGLEGIVNDLEWHNGTLYAATTNAVYRLRTSPDTIGAFEPVSGIRRRTNSTPGWTLLSKGKDLLVGTAYGLAQRRSDGSVKYLFEGEQVFDVLQSNSTPSRIYAATEGGVRLFSCVKGTCRDQDRLIDLVREPRMLAESPDGTLWAGMEPHGLSRIQHPTVPDSTTVEHFGPDDGLPKAPIGPYRWRGEVVFGTGVDIFRFDAGDAPPFSPHPKLEAPPVRVSSDANRVRSEGLVQVHTDEQGRTWGTTGSSPGRWLLADSTWRWRPGGLHRFRRDRTASVAVEDGGTTVWFGMWEDRIIRHVPGSGWEREEVPVRIHRVVDYETDSALAVHGAAEAGADRPRTDDGVQLTYGAPSLVQPSSIEYQYRMRGEEEAWSEWTSRTQQTYRNLGPGDYTFSVRARLAYGDTTEAARYSFTVLAPWYRTWWAYGGYVLLLVGVVAGAVRWRTRQLRQRKEALETAVAERTTEIQRQNEQLADQAERLQKLDEAKTQFFANVSHEFRTPITLILGPVQDLRRRVRDRLPEEVVEALDVVERNAQRLLRLVDQILNIARMDAGAYRLDARPTSLDTEVERIARAFEPLAEREGLTLTTDTGAGDVPDAEPVYADREALEHIVGNLLSNAIKFTPEDGDITVEGVPRADDVLVRVADTGPGIPEEERSAVFDRFQQVDDTNTRPQEGVGIGLAFVQDLVDLHGGDVTLESDEGSGTTVTVRLPRGKDHLSDAHLADALTKAAQNGGPDRPPLANEAREVVREGETEALPVPEESNGEREGSAASAAGTTEDEASRTKQVLIVEDNADVRQYVRSILEPEFVLVEATNGQEGFETARDVLPDVILVDVMMPGMDGHELTRHLKETPETKAIPVIMVTARAATDDEVKGLRVGADDYVTKPFDAAVLRQRVGGVISLQERLRERLRAEGVDAQSAASTEGAPSQSAFEEEARMIIREHLTDADFDVSTLARELAMSRSSLYRTFDEKTDTTPSALITEVRMEQAISLLRAEEGNVTQVAYAVGYEQLSGFSRAFREYFGQPPSTVAAQS